MFNPYVMKKYMVLLLFPILTACALFIGVTFLGFWQGLFCMFGALMVFLLMGYFLLKNPFTGLLEGQGLMLIDLSSTGYIQPYLCRLEMPFMKANINGKKIVDVFDRENGVYNMGAPIKSGTAQMVQATNTPPVSKTEWAQVDGELVIRIPLKDVGMSKFQMLQWPVILFNASTGSTITKDWFSAQEKSAMAEHGLLYMNKMLEELSSNVLHFARSVIEQLRPKSNSFFSGSWWIYVLIAAGILVFFLFFGKPLMGAFQSLMHGGAQALAGTTNAATITPR